MNFCFTLDTRSSPSSIKVRDTSGCFVIAGILDIPALSAYHFAASSELAGISTITVFSLSNLSLSSAQRICQNLYR